MSYLFGCDSGGGTLKTKLFYGKAPKSERCTTIVCQVANWIGVEDIISLKRIDPKKQRVRGKKKKAVNYRLFCF